MSYCRHLDDRWPQEAWVYCQFYVQTYSRAKCQACNGQPKLRGLGDAVAKLTSAVGVKPCAGCHKRQAKLNAAIPFS